MKYRLTILVIMLCLVASMRVAAAGFATIPEKGNMYSLTEIKMVPTKAADPTQTTGAGVGDTGTATPIAVTTTPEASPIAQAQTVIIDGSVTMPAGIALPEGTIANLLLFNSTTQAVEQTIPTTVFIDGSYEFSDIPATTNTVFLVTVDYGGMTFDSSAIAFDGTTTQLSLPVTLYTTSNDMNQLTLTQTHFKFDFSTAGEVQVLALYVISNPIDRAVIITTDGTNLPFIKVPAGATDVNYQLDQNSSPLMKADKGFAFLPGTDKQYGIIATYTLPYTKKMTYTQDFSLPVSTETIIVPEGVRVQSSQLTDAGTQTASGTTYHLYSGSSLASGSTLSLIISGMPGDKAPFTLDQRTLIMIGVGAVGVILIALGIFLFLRDRRLRKLEEEEEAAESLGEGSEEQADAIPEDRDTILDAILALDDQFKAGDLSQDVYKDRRNELKERLKSIS